MSKPALGKNLGQLLNGDAVGGKPMPGKVVSGVQFGRGMDTLVGKPQPEPIASPKKDLLPAWFYFGADLLILAFVAALTKTPAEVIAIQYDSYANLVAMGVIRTPRAALPSPFPGRFVPDPQ